MNIQTDIKRSPIVLIRTFIAIEVLGFICYSLAAALGNYKYDLYTKLSLSSLISYQTAKFLFLSGVQLVITIYAFLRWHFESFALRPGIISRSWGVFFKKTKTVPLSKAISVTMASGPLGKRLHYGTVYIHNTTRENSLTLADISRPEKQLKLIERHINGLNSVSKERPNINLLLSEDEHDQLEFKSSLRFDHKSLQASRELEKATMKTIAAFMNSRGGNIIVGVDNAKKPLGLENDYQTLSRKNADGFENHFTQLFNKMIGPEFRHLAHLWFHAVEGRDICVIQVSPSVKPVYLKLDDTEHFYVRTGNATTPLKLSEVEAYARSRWPRRMS